MHPLAKWSTFVPNQNRLHMAHHHHTHEVTHSTQRVLIVATMLNLLFVGIEAGIGWWQGSLSLLSDAGHNLSDVFSLVLVLVAFRLEKVAKSERYTYGYKKSSVLISLLNAILLLVAVGAIMVESVHKFTEPISVVNGAVISWTAGVGIVINGLTALLLMRNSRHDLNVRGAFLHMAADTLVSVGVVISGVIITYTGWSIVDPIMSILIALVILVSTWHLLVQSLRLSLDGTPEDINFQAVQRSMEQVPHVQAVYHIHIWAMSTTENALTAHVVIDDLQAMEATKVALKQTLATYHLSHSTLEFEVKG